MYDFYYNHNKTKYSGKTELLFTDTNTLLHEIYTENITKFLKIQKIIWFPQTERFKTLL